MKEIKKRLQNGETLIGCWSNLGSPITSEILGVSGFDWILIDLEHGAGSESTVIHQLQAVEHTSAAAVIRVESSQRERMSRVLDMGAVGVMCPRVNSAEQARQVAQSLQYPPQGNRGVARMVRATGFGKRFDDYYEQADKTLLGIVQIETRQALQNLDEIAAVDGIDVLFIGPADLSMELGMYGQFERPEFQDAVKKIVDVAEKEGKATGILLSDPADFSIYRRLGIRFIACGSDATFVARGAADTVEKLKQERKSMGG